MANQAEVVVRNKFYVGGLQVQRMVKGSPVDYNTTIAIGQNEGIPLQSPDVQLVINTPQGKDGKECFLRLRSSVDMSVTFSRTQSTWTFQIIPNELPADIPTTTNISVGEDEPD
jgi:hypothetical protein